MNILCRYNWCRQAVPKWNNSDRKAMSANIHSRIRIKYLKRMTASATVRYSNASSASTSRMSSAIQYSNVISWVHLTIESWRWFALRLRDLRHFNCNIHSDSQMARKSLAGSSGSLSARWPGSNLWIWSAGGIFSFHRSVAVSSLCGYSQWGRRESEVLTGRAEWDGSQNNVNVNHKTQMLSCPLLE